MYLITVRVWHEKFEGLFDQMSYTLDFRVFRRPGQFKNRDLILSLILPDTGKIQSAVSADIPISAKIMAVDPDDAEIPVSHVKIGFSYVRERK